LLATQQPAPPLLSAPQWDPQQSSLAPAILSRPHPTVAQHTPFHMRAHPAFALCPERSHRKTKPRVNHCAHLA
jgi:hypothetical protein